MRRWLWLTTVLISLCAKADLAVVVAADSPLSKLTEDQVASIFLARTNRFPDGARAVPMEVKNNPLRALFYQRIAQKSQSQLSAYWATLVFTGKGKPPRNLGSVGEVPEALMQQPGAITYLDAAAITPRMKVVYRLRDIQLTEALP